MVDMFIYDPFKEKEKRKHDEQTKQDNAIKCDNCKGTGTLWYNSIWADAFEADCPCCYGIGWIDKEWT